MKFYDIILFKRSLLITTDNRGLKADYRRYFSTDSRGQYYPRESVKNPRKSISYPRESVELSALIRSKIMKKGFTLIEMAVVLLIIGILAGVILTNIGGQSIQARDTQKIGHLRNISLYLVQYMAKFGGFPIVSSTNRWDELVEKLEDVGARNLPTSGFEYYYCSDLASSVDATTEIGLINHFVLKTTLEQPYDKAPKIYEGSASSVPSGWACDSTIDCSPSNKYYCLLQ